MAKISYLEHLKKSDISVTLSEIIFNHLKQHNTPVLLEEVVTTTSGGTPDRSNISYYGGNIPWLKSGELNDNIVEQAEEYLTQAGLNNSSAKLFSKGTLLIAMYGATAGKTGILGIDAATNQAICAVTPKDRRISRDFLFWFFRAHRYHFIDVSRGGAQPNISQSVIRETLIPIVSEEEQEKITQFLALVEIKREIDFTLIPQHIHQNVLLTFNHFRCLSELDSESEKQEHYLTQLRQTILQEAIEGKLTAGWRAQHPVQPGDPETDAAALLAQIQAEKARLVAEKQIKPEKPLPPIREEEMPFALPIGWVWCRLGRAAQSLTYGTSQKCSYDDTQNSKVLRIPNVSNGLIDDGDLKYTNLDPAEITHLSLCDGDLLIIRSNGSAGIVGSMIFVPAKFSRYCFAGYLIRLRFVHREAGRYIATISRTQFMRSQIEDPLRTTVGIKNINSQEIFNLIIPLPPLAEQRAIVNRVDRLLAQIDELAAQVAERKAQADALMQAVLCEAFAEGKS